MRDQRSVNLQTFCKVGWRKDVQLVCDGMRTFLGLLGMVDLTEQKGWDGVFTSWRFTSCALAFTHMLTYASQYPGKPGRALSAH